MNDELKDLIETIRLDLGFYENGLYASKEIDLANLLAAVHDLVDYYVSNHYDGGE